MKEVLILKESVDIIIFNKIELETDAIDALGIDPQSMSCMIENGLIEKTDIIILPADSVGYQLAASFSALLDIPTIIDCVNLRIDNEKIHAEKYDADGSLLVYELDSKNGTIVLLKNNALFRELRDRVCETSYVEIGKNSLIEQVSRKKKENVELNITNSNLVFAGGRGVLDTSFADLRKLAGMFNAATGASRPLVNNGIASKKEQIGQTGFFIKPDVYIAFGISGAVQHMMAVKESKCIVGVNTDINAPIIKHCDYAVIADAGSIIRNMLMIL